MHIALIMNHDEELEQLIHGFDEEELGQVIRC
jgi:hypothetical protein